jgi:anthranilate synthase/aminodeoxychorismate synthase-like glutamine amidotransferase
MILIIDNYDSFVYNVFQYVSEFNNNVLVKRPDELSIKIIENNLKPEKIIISPGPKRPGDATFSKKVIKYFHNKLPILGICLGHQCIAEVFDATVDVCDKPYHAYLDKVTILEKDILFSGITNTFNAVRYHSLKIIENSVNKTKIKILAKSKNNDIMAIKIVDSKTYGIQYHPESILTEYGKTLIKNFVKKI